MTPDDIEKHGKRFDELEKKLAEHIAKCEVCQGDEPCEVGEGMAKELDQVSEAIVKAYEAEKKAERAGSAGKAGKPAKPRKEGPTKRA